GIIAFLFTSHSLTVILLASVFLFLDPATPVIYPLSLHDALPISGRRRRITRPIRSPMPANGGCDDTSRSFRHGSRAENSETCHQDRKSTRLNSSHSQISYAVFCLKKKKKNIQNNITSQKSSGDQQ